MITTTLDIQAFPGLTYDETITLYKDGRVASKFLEVWFAKQYNMDLVDSKNYDFIDQEGNQVEFKTLTKGGCNILPSRMKGASRKVNPEEAREVICANIYLICDIRNFPEISYTFIPGKELLNFTKSFKIQTLAQLEPTLMDFEAIVVRTMEITGADREFVEAELLKSEVEWGQHDAEGFFNCLEHDMYGITETANMCLA